LAGQAQNAIAEGCREYATSQIAVFGPEVEDAAAVFGRERVLGLAKIKEWAAVFEEDGAGVLGEEGLQGFGDLLGGLGRLGAGSDESMRRHAVTVAGLRGERCSTLVGWHLCFTYPCALSRHPDRLEMRVPPLHFISVE
jgi:hypothetical protein